MATKRDHSNKEDDFRKFVHRLPPTRRGQAHDSYESFRAATGHFTHTSQKEYTLVLVTEPKTQRMLLGAKHRGFGVGMNNSFGGKLEPNESIMEGAIRELEEETGISGVTEDHVQSVARLHFTFVDSERKMLVHLLRVNVDTSGGADDDTGSSSYFPLDPSIIRPCDEITPFWIDDWFQVPLNNMFADDSVWLVRVLSAPPSEPMFIEGHFHFAAGGQETNTILHHFMDIQADTKPSSPVSSCKLPSASSPPPKRTLEQRLFHELHRSDVTSPNIKEFKECWAFCKAIHNNKNSRSMKEFDLVLDVAGGHGALAAMLLLTTTATEAVVIDPAMVGNGSVERAWGPLLQSKNKSLRFRHECLRTALPVESERAYAKNSKCRILVVAIHACQHLSDDILCIACRDYHVTAAAVMPCCQKDASPGSSWKRAAKSMGVPIAKVMDVLLAGKVMSWGLDYDVRMKLVDQTITPQNRIIVCKRRTSEKQDDQNQRRHAAHSKLAVAYRRAHQHEKVEQSNSSSQAPKGPSRPVLRLGWGRRLVESQIVLGALVGFGLGVAVSVLATMRLR